MGVFGITLKLTAGVLLLLLLKPAYELFKERRYREIVLCLLTGLFVLAPWMLRTAFLSGYLLYPFPALDVLHVDWKIDAAAAALDAAEIKTWGRGLNNAALAGLPVKEWFPHWFQTMLPATGKLLILADLACIVIFAVFAIRLLIKAVRKENVYNIANRVLVLAAVAVSYLFWQLSAPLLSICTSAVDAYGRLRVSEDPKKRAHDVLCSRAPFSGKDHITCRLCDRYGR